MNANYRQQYDRNRAILFYLHITLFNKVKLLII